MFVGIDVGTSAVKIVVTDQAQQIVAVADQPLKPRQPRPNWSEDDADAWWFAVDACMRDLRNRISSVMARVDAIGLSGQMHGALLLDAQDRQVRPAILWNDGRSAQEADELASMGLGLQGRLGVRPMPGFTGPKIAWLRRHEPEVLDRATALLLPKDYVRLKMTGERVTDVSDAAGTWLLDQGSRNWSAEALNICGVERAWLPRLVESNEPSGFLRAAVADQWGVRGGIPVAGGGGDVAVGGVGIGAVEEGQGFISLGTSAQVFLANSNFRPNPERLVHSFCHALPARWYSMAALLNGASPLAAVVAWTGGGDIGAALDSAAVSYEGPSKLLALPYLTGERTPHNDAAVRGAIIGLDAATCRNDIVQAVIESVAFSLADGLEALVGGNEPPRALGLIGGGSRSKFWASMIANILGVTIKRYRGGDRGPAYGAARLARLCVSGETIEQVVISAEAEETFEADPRLYAAYRPRLAAFRSLYRALKPEFAQS